MTSVSTGGGSGSVAASAHAGCMRYRGTDPVITGRSRRSLADSLGHPDTSAGIPEARWMRAATFESLVHRPAFASEIATRALGDLGLDRPDEVAIANCGVSLESTLRQLRTAHQTASSSNTAVMLYGLALPFPGFDPEASTPVKPDFAIVAPATNAHVQDESGSVLIMGDAKDYERIRSRIDDSRMMKGFLQVAQGAEAAVQWSQLPSQMSVSDWGVLAVPRNSFLQPTPVVEQLDDYRAEVRLRNEQRLTDFESAHSPVDDLRDLVTHLDARFDPGACTACAMFRFCRSELRESESPEAILVELGVPAGERDALLPIVNSEAPEASEESTAEAMVLASVTGSAVPTGQLRTDPAGSAGTIDVVLAKSDAAALGVHGIGLRRSPAEGPLDWQFTAFDAPQSPATRTKIMHLLGRELEAAMAQNRRRGGDVIDPVHLCVPDPATADLLTSIADNLAGIELSRLRWQHDLDQGREPLTYDGEPATVPRPLRATARLAVSFLLEEDRARAFQLRSPIVDVRSALARHIVPGGPAVASQRLDYLSVWAQARVDGEHVDHRALQDDIEQSLHTPGARLSNTMSDEFHSLLSALSSGDSGRTANGYSDAVIEELTYKAEVLDRSISALEAMPVSKVRPALQLLESRAQEVWRRRYDLRANDLVRFGRTYRGWRNSLVNPIAADALCHTQLSVLINAFTAAEAARDAGNRDVARAVVTSVDPFVTLDIESRRFKNLERVVALHHNRTALVERDVVKFSSTKGSVKFSSMPVGLLAKMDSQDEHEMPAPSRRPRFAWAVDRSFELSVGDELIIAKFDWFGNLKKDTYLPVSIPPTDTTWSPKEDCDATTYLDNPDRHRWCCKPHPIAESEFSDQLAARRMRGELNPETWPPVHDGDAFDVKGKYADGNSMERHQRVTVPSDLTIDDVE